MPGSGLKQPSITNKCQVGKVCKNRCLAVDFLLQNKYRRRINTAGHLGLRLVLYGYRASAKHHAGCPAAG